MTFPSYVASLLLMREGDLILGMVNLLFTISAACGGKVANLKNMIIHPSRHSDGLGSQLLQAAKVFAQCEGCKRITLLTDRANDSPETGIGIA